jgi:hypothetical protein
MRNVRLLYVFFALALVQAAIAAVPSDPAAFTNYVQAVFEKQLPGYTFEQPGRLTLKGAGPEGKTTGDITLDRIHGYCAANPDAAEAAVAHYVRGLLTVINPEPVSLSPDMIRLVVRREAYMQDAIARMGPGRRAAFFRPLAPGLVLVPVIDLPASLRYIGDKDLVELKMTDAEVFRTGENNFMKSAEPFSKAARVPPKRGLGFIREEYAPTRLAFHDDWAPLAKKLHGKLVVMVPASDLVMFVEDVDRYALDALRTIGSDTGRKSDRPLSDILLKWTKTGWEKVEP